MWTATGGLVAIRRFEWGTDMSLIQLVFGSSPFHPLVEHASKVDECVQLLNPLISRLTSLWSFGESLVKSHRSRQSFWYRSPICTQFSESVIVHL